MKNKHTQLLYNFANNILSAFGAFTGAAVTDKINRRPRLYIGAFTLAVLLSIVAALSSEYGKAGNTNTNGATMGRNERSEADSSDIHRSPIAMNANPPASDQRGL